MTNVGCEWTLTPHQRTPARATWLSMRYQLWKLINNATKTTRKRRRRGKPCVRWMFLSLIKKFTLSFVDTCFCFLLPRFEAEHHYVDIFSKGVRLNLMYVLDGRKWRERTAFFIVRLFFDTLRDGLQQQQGEFFSVFEPANESSRQRSSE